MNWLTNYVRPKISKLVPKKDIPDNLWTGCPKCEKMVFHKELEEKNLVCANCGHHFPLPPLKRMEMLFDGGHYSLIQVPEVKADPLDFSDLKKYPDRLKDARKKTKQDDAMIVGYGTIGNVPAVAGVLNFDFMGGSMGAAVGEAILAAANLAILQDAALILVTASGGARMQEGMISLMQMPRTTLAVKQLKEKGLPFIMLFTHPTAGGVTASFAMLGDVALAEPGATIAFAGRRVIEQTVREKLPDNFQTSEYLLEHGMLDQVLTRDQIRPELVKILHLLMMPKK